MPQERSAGAVVFYKRGTKIEYLLLRYGARHWDFPKGHIEKGEGILDTVRRETKEETGIEAIEIIPGFKEHISYFFRKPKTWAQKEFGGARKRMAHHRLATPEPGAIFKIVTFFLARSNTKKVTLSFEHIGYTWLSYEKAYQQLTFKNAKEILRKAHAFLILRG